MQMKEISVNKHISTRLMTTCVVLCAGFGAAISAAAAGDDASSVIVDRKIGYVVYDKHWDVYVTPEKTECKGFNTGPREQWKILFPDNGRKWTFVETQLAREGEIWFPSTEPEAFPFYEITGQISNGLNLDGKIDPNDFTSPEGEKGIDNQLYRATGCINAYRGPDGFHYNYLQKQMITNNYNRISIELSDVDSLVNDDDVTVTSFHTRDFVTLDANGAFLEGGTQRVDYRWGKKFITHFKGKIVDGLLTTEPVDMYFPDVDIHTNINNHYIRGGRWQLKLTPNHAEGHLAGYADVTTFYETLNQTMSTSHQSYGQLSSPSLFRALHRLADGYPDPKTGKYTAISSALQLKFVQAFIDHSQNPSAPKKVAEQQAPVADIAVANLSK